MQLSDPVTVCTGILAMKDGAARTTLKDAMDETEMVIFDVVENLLRNNNVDPQEVRSFEMSAISGCSSS
jgi:hypothetical protein